MFLYKKVWNIFDPHMYTAMYTLSPYSYHIYSTHFTVCSLKSKWYKVVYNIRYKKSSPSEGLAFVVALKEEQCVELSARVCAQISVFGL